MDNQLVFDVLSNALAASGVVGDDVAFRDTLRQTIDRLPPMRIGRHGQLQEWLDDRDNSKDEHRHISHLYGFTRATKFLRIIVRNCSGRHRPHWNNEATRQQAGVSVGKSTFGHVCWMATMPSV